jgi:hypothetical protein
MLLCSALLSSEHSYLRFVTPVYKPSCNLCFICSLAGEGVPPVHGLIPQQATGDHSKTVAHGGALKLAQR